ncbi:CRISPR-associated protein Cas4 [Halomicrococcus sp. NG-SE-24]|uniref:CRISPR-associated protein Cas4 n=1 Tax=Halomicrococcus sp. NG-SE-24 TaxID=3436928 RepID=UPI003D985409
MTDASIDPVERFLDAAKDETKELPFRLTGVMFQYYIVCERELWFLSRDVEIDRDTLAIVRGSDVDNSAYSDKRRDVRVDGIIAIDVLDSGEILEVKPSSSMTEPARLQLLFYLWYLDHVVGVEKSGVLAHPTEKRREQVELTPKTRDEVESAIRDIRDVVTAESPPPAEEKPVCDSCAYHDFCWSC